MGFGSGSGKVKTLEGWHKSFLPAVLILMAIAPASAAPAKDKDKDKPKPAGPQMVDSGTFGLFINGQRMATETFSIQQSLSGSLVKSNFKAEKGAQSAEQSSEWEMTPSGDLRSYSWKETLPGKAQATVVPNDTFLVERSTENPQGKEHEQPFLLPLSTSMFDDYAFVQREVLAWRYLATGCRQNQGRIECQLHQKTQFGVLNPNARASLSVSLEYAGREKVTIRGAEQELIRLNLTSESGDWAMWLNDQFKVMRMVAAGSNTEVIRD
jgi:hypothetical protein